MKEHSLLGVQKDIHSNDFYMKYCTLNLSQKDLIDISLIAITSNKIFM